MMSLISAKNLIAPIRNKVHLVTIVLVTLAFAVLRFSGGDVKVLSKKNYYKSKNYDNNNYDNFETYEEETEEKDVNSFFRTPKPEKEKSQTLIDIEKELGL